MINSKSVETMIEKLSSGYVGTFSSNGLNMQYIYFLVMSFPVLLMSRLFKFQVLWKTVY